jgi:hypothetical protein
MHGIPSYSVPLNEGILCNRPRVGTIIILVTGLTLEFADSRCKIDARATPASTPPSH